MPHSIPRRCLLRLLQQKLGHPDRNACALTPPAKKKARAVKTAPTTAAIAAETFRPTRHSITDTDPDEGRLFRLLAALLTNRCPVEKPSFTDSSSAVSASCRYLAAWSR